MNNRIFSELKNLYKDFNNIQIINTNNNVKIILSCRSCCRSYPVGAECQSYCRSCPAGSECQSINKSACQSRLDYTFILPISYPFKKPAMYINDTSYASFLKINSKFTRILTKLSGSDCLCCSSINCEGNWLTTYPLMKFIDEFKQNLIIKKQLVLLYFINQIKTKYNINFPFIEEFLI